MKNPVDTSSLALERLRVIVDHPSSLRTTIYRNRRTTFPFVVWNIDRSGPALRHDERVVNHDRFGPEVFCPMNFTLHFLECVAGVEGLVPATAAFFNGQLTALDDVESIAGMIVPGERFARIDR